MKLVGSTFDAKLNWGAKSRSSDLWRIRKICRSQGGRDGCIWILDCRSKIRKNKRTKSVGSLEVFTDSAADDFPTIWAKLPQSLILEGGRRGGGK